MLNKKGYILIVSLILGLILSFSAPTVFAQSSEDTGDNENDIKTSISSPDGKVHLNFNLPENGTPHYQVSFNAVNLIEPSSLGFNSKNQTSTGDQVEIVKPS